MKEAAQQLLAKTIISQVFSREKHHVSQRSWAPLVIDGPVGAGSSTQVALWKETFGFTSLTMGECFRIISLISLENGLNPEHIIAAAEQGLLTLAVQDSEDGHRVYEVSLNTDEKQVLQRVDTQAIKTEMHSPAVTEFVAHLNGDSYRAVEAVVLQALNPYLEHAQGIVMEGRNLAFVTTVPHAFYLAVSQEVAQDRARAREAQRLRAKGEPVVEAALERQARLVRERNAIDMQNGILLTQEQALMAPEYTAVFNTDRASAERIFVSMVMLHELLTNNEDLSDLSFVQLAALRYIVGFDNRTEQSRHNSVVRVTVPKRVIPAARFAAW